MISCWICGSSAPDMPLQVVHANATTPNPSCSSSVVSFASSRYSATALEPGASELFTHGLRLRPSRFALRASSPAAITLRGLLVLVQLVIAAMITAPSGILPGSSCPRCPRCPWPRDRSSPRAHADSRGPPCCARHSTGRTAARARTRPSAGCPPTARVLRVGLDQLDLRVVATRELQVRDRLRVDEEHRRRRAVLRRHVGDRRAIAQRQRGGAFAEELEVRTDHLLLAQELGQRQHDVGGGDAGLRLAGELHADDVRQAHPRRATEHDAFGFEAADADGDHAERIDVRRVAVGADQRVREARRRPAHG